MSHAIVTVCLPPTPPGDVYAAVAAAMEPFNRESEVNGWVGAWDSWRIHDVSPFPVRPEADGDPRLVYRDQWEPSSDRHRTPLRCDGGPVELLDLGRMRDDAIAEAKATWQWRLADWNRLVSEHPPALPLTAFLALHDADPHGYSRRQAIADHHGQPLVKALNNHAIWTTHPGVGLWQLGPNTDPVSYFARDPQPDLDDAAMWAIATYAVVTLDGLWIDPDRPGPWRADLPGSDKQAGYDHQTAAYAREATRYIENLENGCVIVQLNYHC